MIVACANCQTEFSLDERHLGPEGAAVRCSVCGHVFRAEPPAGLSERPWQIRTLEAELFTAPDLATLRQWITEGRLHPDDEVSRTGRHWVRLGDMPELADAFAAFVELRPVVSLVSSESSTPHTAAAQALGPPPEFGTAEASGGSSRASAMELVGELERGSSRPWRGTQILGSGGIRAQKGADEDLERTPASGDVVMASPPRPRPASMLQAVTAHVHPITRASEPAEPKRPASAPTPAAAPASDSGEYGRAAPRSRDFGEFDDLPPRRSVSPWVAGLAVASVGIALSIPGVRASLFGGGGEASPTESVEQVAVAAEPLPKEIDAADRALTGTDPAELGRIEAVLQARIDEGGMSKEASAVVRLAQAELLATRSVLSRVRASLQPDAAPTANAEADDDARRATTLLEGVDIDAITARDRVRRTRSRVRLAQGRPSTEIDVLLPEQGPGIDELRIVVAGSSLWRDGLAAPELTKLVEGLEARADRSALGNAVLALAHRRSGDEAKAEQTLAGGGLDEGRLASALRSPSPTEPVAVGAPASQVQAAGPGAEVEAAAVPKPDEPSEADDGKPKPVSTDRLIGRGCDKVDAGDAKGGLELLVQAKERRPGDLDIAVCIADAYRKQGKHDDALAEYERALDRSPRLIPALRGAARTAKRLGDTAKAKRYYERLLGVYPSDGEASDFLAAQTTGSNP